MTRLRTIAAWALHASVSTIATSTGLCAVALIVLYAFPFVGMYVAVLTTMSLGCTYASLGVEPCSVLGYDIGPNLKIMFSFEAMLITPLFFLFAFGKELLVLGGTAAVFMLIASKTRSLTQA